MLGAAYGQTGRFEEAVSPYKKALLRGRGSEFSDIAAHLGLASAYIALGREKEARAEAAEVLRINPRFTIKGYAKTFPVLDQSRFDGYFSRLRKAGLN